MTGETDIKKGRMSGLDRAIQVLDYLCDCNSPASAYAIAKGVGAPLSTIYTIIEELVEKDVLLRSTDGSVWLGQRLFRYGLAYGHALDFLQVATHEMHELCRKVGETIQVCGRDNDQMVVLAMAEGPGHFRVASRVGTRVPLNWTASGRLLVGHLDRASRIELFQKHAKSSPTGRAITDAEQLSEMSAKALEERLEIQLGESDFSVACIASPILTKEGECRATISIVMSDRKVEEEKGFYANAVMDAARRIEQLLGWNRSG